MRDRLALFPDQASTLAPHVDHLLYFLLTVTTFFSVLIFVLIFVFAIRYRRRSEDEMPVESHGASRRLRPVPHSHGHTVLLRYSVTRQYGVST